MESAAFKKLTEQLTEIVQYVRLAKMAFQENLTGKGWNMSMEDGTLRKLELYLHDLHKKIDGIYDMLMLRHERETEQKGSSAINEKLLDNQDLCLLFQISPRSLQRYRSLGVLPYKRLGQKTYYTEEDVMQFVENNVKEFKKENVEHDLTRIHQKFK